MPRGNGTNQGTSGVLNASCDPLHMLCEKICPLGPAMNEAEILRGDFTGRWAEVCTADCITIDVRAFLSSILDRTERIGSEGARQVLTAQFSSHQIVSPVNLDVEG